MLKVKRKSYLTDDAGKRVAVVLDMKTFEQIEDELDELACIQAYDKAKPETDAAISRGDYITLEEYLAKHNKKRKVRHRNRIR